MVNIIVISFLPFSLLHNQFTYEGETQLQKAAAERNGYPDFVELNLTLIRLATKFEKPNQQIHFCFHCNQSLFMWGAYFCMGAYKYIVVVGNQICSYLLLIFYRCLLLLKYCYVTNSLIPRPSSRVVSCPDPSPKSGRRVWCSEWLFLSHRVGSNAVKNVIIAFPHALHAAYKMIPSCAVGTIALPLSNSVAPLIQHLPLTRRLWSTLLLLVRN